MMKYPFFLLIVLIFSGILYSQTDDIQLGSLNQFSQAQGGLFDYSDPAALNIRVSVWGFAKYPGRYIIPNYTSVTDLLSLAGGPTDDADLEDLRIFRVKEDSSYSMISFNYNDLLWNKEIKAITFPPQLQAGDILLVPGSPRLYFKDYFQISLSVFSALISLAILVLNIAK